MQRLFRDAADGVFVVDDHDEFAVAARKLVFCGDDLLGNSLMRAGGEIDFELRSFAGFAVDVDESVVAFDNREHGGKAETGAFTDVFSREEWIEDFVAN